MSNNDNNNSSEGLLLTVGLLIVVICVLGSMTTGTGPVEFFFYATLSLAAIGLTLGVFLGVSIFIVHMMKVTKKQDDRPFLQRLKEDYSWMAVKEDFQIIFEHVGKYIKEEWNDGPGSQFNERYGSIKEKILALTKKLQKK